MDKLRLLREEVEVCLWSIKCEKIFYENLNDEDWQTITGLEKELIFASRDNSSDRMKDVLVDYYLFRQSRGLNHRPGNHEVAVRVKNQLELQSLLQENADALAIEYRTTLIFVALCLVMTIIIQWSIS